MALKKKEAAKNFIFGEYLTEMVLFLLAVFVATLWINHHFASATWFVAGMYGFGLFYGSFGLLLKLAEEGDTKSFKARSQKVLLLFLHPFSLFVVYMLLIGFCNSLTTIHVYGLDSGSSVKMALQLDDDVYDSIEVNEKEVKIVPVFTNPFGKSFTIAATGYRNKTMELYPWTATRVRLDTDLEELPSILFRVYGDPANIEDGTFVIRSNRYPDRAAIVPIGADGIGSVMIGKRKLIPDLLVKSWSDGLAGKAASDDVRMRILNGWKKFAHTNEISFVAGDQLEVTVMSLGKEVQASTTVDISNAPFQDFEIFMK